MKILRKYWQPTPKKWRKIGDSLLAVASFASTYQIISHNEKIALALMFVGIAGKFLTNFFNEPENHKTEK